MAAALVRAALAGSVSARRYWLVTRGGPEWLTLTVEALRGDDEEVEIVAAERAGSARRRRGRGPK